MAQLFNISENSSSTNQYYGVVSLIKTLATSAYLSIDFVDLGGRGIEGEEQIISAPFDEVSHMVVFTNGLIFVIVFNETPTEHSHSK